MICHECGRMCDCEPKYSTVKGHFYVRIDNEPIEEMLRSYGYKTGTSIFGNTSLEEAKYEGNLCLEDVKSYKGYRIYDHELNVVYSTLELAV